MEPENDSNSAQEIRVVRGGDRRSGRRGASPAVFVGFGIVVVLVAIGAVPRFERQRRLGSEARAAVSTPIEVDIVHPRAAPDSTETVLPGSVQAMDETTVNARATGYVRNYYVDIGSHVHAGQLLAEIESPDMDQQVLSAQADAQKSEAGVGQSEADVARLEADVAQANAGRAAAAAALGQTKADVTRYLAKQLQAKSAISSARSNLSRAIQNLAARKADLSRAQVASGITEKTLTRWKQLGAVNAVSGQEVDEKQADYDTARDSATAAQAAVDSAGADVDAARNAVEAAQADADAAAADVDAARERVSAAQAALLSSRSGVTAAEAGVNAGKETISAAQAATRSSDATVQRYAALQGFQRIVAPFNGVITARNIDVGTLVSAGTTPGGAEADPSRTVTHSGLFGIARTDSLRIEVDVPQSLVSELRVGQPARVSLREFPGKTFDGQILDMSGALDASSRTMLVEVRLPNPKDALTPGMYADVAFVGAHSRPELTVPANTLLVDASGVRVATLTPADTVHFETVQIGQDRGSTVEIANGLSVNDSLIADPSDDLTEGERVRIAGNAAEETSK